MWLAFLITVLAMTVSTASAQESEATEERLEKALAALRYFESDFPDEDQGLSALVDALTLENIDQVGLLYCEITNSGSSDLFAELEDLFDDRIVQSEAFVHQPNGVRLYIRRSDNLTVAFSYEGRAPNRFV